MEVIHGILHALSIPLYVISVPIDFRQQIDIKQHAIASISGMQPLYPLIRIEEIRVE